MWPTWQQAWLATAVLGALTALFRNRRNRYVAGAAEFTGETALVCFLYGIWRLARMLPLTHADGAVERGRQIWRFEQWLHLPSELALERWVLPNEWLSRASNIFYATVHVPALLVFLVWMFVRHRDKYPRWRNALAITTGFCLFIRFVRVAPPRLLPDLGFVDLAAHYGQSVYGPVGTGVSDQYAAMPSIHVAWAVLVGWAVVTASTSRWRHLVLAHPILTILVVSATANHWWLDGIVAIILLALSLAIDSGVRQLFARRRQRRKAADPPDGPTDEPEHATATAAR